MREGVRLAAESSADEGPDDVDLVHRYVQHGRKRTMRVVRHLLRGVQLQTTVGVPVRHDGMWFGEPVMNPLETPSAPGAGGCVLDVGTVAKGLVNALLHVGPSNVVFAAPVNGLVDVFKPFLDRVRFQFLIIDHDGPEGFHRRRFIDRGDAATRSPTWRTFSTAIACSSLVTGKTPKVLGASSPVAMANTPGMASAAEVSMERIRA